MRNRIFIIKYIAFFLLIMFLVGCKLAKQLALRKVDDNLVVRYALYYNNRSANHKPEKIIVSVDTLNTRDRNHSLYQFYLNSNKIEKFQNYGGQRSNYVLVIDSTNYDSNGKSSSVNTLESQIFEKIIYFSDSLKLKDFNFLRKVKGFKLIQENNARYR